jgi:hypothetical protein
MILYKEGRKEGVTFREAVSVFPAAIGTIPFFFSNGTWGLLSGRPQHGSTQRKGSPLLQRVR